MENINVETLKEIVRIIITTYMQDKYKGFPNVENEISRINDIIDNSISVNIITREKGDPIGGNNNGGKINLAFIEGKITSDNIGSAIQTLVHEIFHSISKNPFGDKVSFVEEAYVTLATAESMRNIISKSDGEFEELFSNIEGTEDLNLKEILINTSLLNGYETESSVIRCNDIIMKNLLNIDSLYEYIFSENGFERLVELSRKIDEEYGAFFYNLKSKGLTSNALIFDTEKELIFELLNRCDLENITETNVEMNELLVSYFIENYKKYSDLVKKFPQLYQEFVYRKIADAIKIIRNPRQITETNSDIFNLLIDYDLNMDINAKADQWGLIWKNNLKPIQKCLGDFKGSLTSTNAFPIIFAYDLLSQDLTQTEFSEKLKKYLDITGFYEEDRIAMLTHQTYKVIPFVKSQINAGKSLSDVINKYIEISLSYDIKAHNLCESINGNNFWDIVSQLADEAIKHESKFCGFDGFTTFYSYVSQQCAKVYFKDKGFENAEIFTERMQEIFNRFREHEFYERIFLTPQALSVIGVAQNLKYGDEKDGKLAKEFIEWLDKTKCNLGEYKSNINYSKLVYFLYLSFGNMDPNQIDSFSEHFINVYSNHLFKFADILSRKSANLFVNLGNMHINEILKSVSERFIELIGTDEEKALKMIKANPNIIKFYSNSFEVKNKFQEAILKKAFGPDKYEKRKKERGKEHLEFYDFRIYSLKDIDSLKDINLSVKNIMKIYILNSTKETLSMNLKQLESGQTSSLYYCNSIMEDIADLAQAGYIMEASHFLDKYVELHKSKKNIVLTKDSTMWYTVQEIIKYIAEILKVENFPKENLISISKDFIELGKWMSSTGECTKSFDLQISELSRIMNEISVNRK